MRIRDYNGEIRICSSCAQPCYLGPVGDGKGWQHFREQWDGISCEYFPLAGNVIPIRWGRGSLADLKAKYPDTYPDEKKRWGPTGKPL